jgi:hypothetical protein
MKTKNKTFATIDEYQDNKDNKAARWVVSFTMTQKLISMVYECVKQLKNRTNEN